MSEESTDHLVHLAQMLADTDESNIKSRIDSYLPLAFIIIVGLIIAAIALYSAKLWEDHVERNISKTIEQSYTNEVNRNLFNMRQNTHTIAGFVEASDFISQQEFHQFSKQLLKNQLTTQFVALLNYKNANYIELEHSDSSDHIVQSILNFNAFLSSTTNASSDQETYFILHNASGHQDYIVYFYRSSLPDEGSYTIIASGIHLETLIAGITEEHPAGMTIQDSYGSSTEAVLHESRNASELHTVPYAYENLGISLLIPNALSALQSASYLKWVLILFSIAFTLTLCVQFVLAKRSMKNLANLAVQRANDLTSINSELTDEIMNRIEFQSELVAKNQEIQTINSQLEKAHNQLVQQEKLASLGQLAAGVAHEINNPVGFINSNLTMLAKYTTRTLQLIENIEHTISALPDTSVADQLEQEKKKYKFKSVKNNMLAVIEESLEGVDRVKKIVQDLKNFSRIDDAEWQWTDIHSGIDSTLNIAWNEIKYKAEVHKEYGILPNIECVPSQINQVFMNLLVNSAHAMNTTGNIYVRTSVLGEHVVITIEDDGCGIPNEIIGKIFDPFFTTKDVGKGTGLGLSLSYGIVKKHNGDLSVNSTPGKGTTFTITLPISRNHPTDKAV